MDLMWLIYQNKDAILGLPAEVKIGALVLLAVFIVVSLIKKAFKLLKFALICAAAYFLLTYFGVL